MYKMIRNLQIIIKRLITNIYKNLRTKLAFFSNYLGEIHWHIF